MGMLDPTMVCGRGTGLSGMATDEGALGAASGAVGAAPASAAALATALGAGVAVPVGAGVAFFSSQAAEASKIPGSTQASQRMRAD
jgi:hypothetical protein